MIYVWCVNVTEEARKEKKKKEKEKDSDKPDTFLEKLIVHLTKNMQVHVHVCLYVLAMIKDIFSLA